MPEKIRGGGELFKYQWTTGSRIQQFPFKFYWKNARVFRYYIYAGLAFAPAFLWLTKLTYNPANVRQWEEIRAHRRHTYFEVPKDH